MVNSLHITKGRSLFICRCFFTRYIFDSLRTYIVTLFQYHKNLAQLCLTINCHQGFCYSTIIVVYGCLQLNLHETDLLFRYLSHHLTWHCSSISEDLHRFARNLQHMNAKLFLLLFLNNFKRATPSPRNNNKNNFAFIMRSVMTMKMFAT